MTLVSLSEHNNSRRLLTMNDGRPVKNGIACPKCGAELLDSDPTRVLTSDPPQHIVHCDACEYKGTRY